MEKLRSGYIDALRIAAIVCVLFNHQSIYYEVNDPVLCAFSILTKIGPPMFFMISGALLLGKEESFAHILKHRISRILIVMLARSVLVLLLMPQYRSHPLQVFISGNIWFLYAYLGFLLMLPFLRHIAKGANETEQKVFIALSIICYLIAGLSRGFSFTEGFTQYLPLYTSVLPKLSENIVFPLIGYFLAKGQLIRGAREKLLLALTAALHVILSVCLIKASGSSDHEHLEDLRMYFVIPLAILIFVLARDHITKANKYLQIAAGTVFGIFILDTTFFLAGDIEGFITSAIPGIPQFAACTLVVIAEFAAYGALTYLLKLIPPVRKVL